MKNKFRNNMFTGEVGELSLSDFPTSYKVEDSSPSAPVVTPPNQNQNTEDKNNDSESDDYTPSDKDPNMENVKYLSKNKTMTYSDTQAQTASVSDIKKIRSTLSRYLKSKSLDVLPPGYYDNLKYQHRIDAEALADEARGMSNSRDVIKDDEIDPDRILRIGDCHFVIPPEFISVNSSSTHESIQGIRQSGSTYIKNGYIKKDIQISLVLNGMDQINGYEVESPINGVKYHVDGLRALLSQFKFTPFLPIKNNVINFIHGVNNVALRNVAVETIVGFPETLNVTLSLQEFNIESFVYGADSWFDDCIDWDLFRWYTQRPLIGKTKTKLHKITSPRLTNQFSFKILTQDALMNSRKKADNWENGISKEDEMFIDLTNDKNYEKIVDSSSNVDLTYLGFSVGNIMPSMQLSYNESPIMQYMGATDTSFTISLQTKDASVAQMFDSLNKENLSIVRKNRFTNGIGFIKVENELVRLTGTEFMIMSDLSVTTVPNFPGLFNITVSCLSYDSNQSSRETLR
ncbi:MAG: baseplate hub protein, partial [Peptostreptococcaceae bacterium]